MPDTAPHDEMLGKPAPLFNLPSSAGGEVSLSETLRSGRIILFFVREYN